MNDGHKCIAIVQYRPLEDLPPVMNLILVLKDLGYHVHCITFDTEAGRDFLSKHEIESTFIKYNSRLLKSSGFLSLNFQRIRRMFSFFPRRNILATRLLELKRKYKNILVWFQESTSAAALGQSCWNYKYRLLTLFELNDRGGARWFGYDFNRFLRATLIVVPEYNRAWILKGYYGLSRLPMVITNKPCRDLPSENSPLPAEINDVFSRIGKRPIFIYQGAWGGDRDDVLLVLETIAKYRPQYCVISMPGTERVRAILSPYSNAFVLPRIPPPLHLQVTRRATIGIAVYNEDGVSCLSRLNAVYCAPNKIFEYASLGLPTLGNDIPGLKYSTQANGAGVCCSMDKESILAAADQLVSNIISYRSAAIKFSSNINTIDEVSLVLHQVGWGHESH